MHPGRASMTSSVRPFWQSFPYPLERMEILTCSAPLAMLPQPLTAPTLRLRCCGAPSPVWQCLTQPISAAGWPAELLRCARYHVPSDTGIPIKVWILAPLLTGMFDTCFQSGAVPVCVTSVLVTPMFNRGNDLDTANQAYRCWRAIVQDAHVHREFFSSASLTGHRGMIFAAEPKLVCA